DDVLGQALFGSGAGIGRVGCIGSLGSAGPGQLAGQLAVRIATHTARIPATTHTAPGAGDAARTGTGAGPGREARHTSWETAPGGAECRDPGARCRAADILESPLGESPGCTRDGRCRTCSMCWRPSA